VLGIRIRAALASFETAAKFGLDFPAGTDRETVAWKQAIEQKETCPECAKRAPLKQLMDEYCPWCGWQSAYSKRLEENGAAELESSEESSESETDSEAASSK
jgi:gas vesicle structural protein